MILKSLQTGLVVLTAATAAACSTMGTGEGDMRGGGPGVRFDWKAEDAVHGQLTATLANGKTYEGKLFQITSDTRVEEVEPLWVGWHRHWREWGYWNPGPEFITHYSGRVVANLSDAEGEHMRCNFHLMSPARGMVGGGEGRCQLADGHTIDATFPAA